MAKKVLILAVIGLALTGCAQRSVVREARSVANEASLLTFDFRVTGEEGAGPVYSLPAIPASRSLKMRITAVRSPVQKSSNFSVNDQCVSFEVVVNGKAQETKPLNISGSPSDVCPSIESSQTFDLSELFRYDESPPVRIQVQKPKSDVYCALWKSGWIIGRDEVDFCPLHSVLKTHEVAGRIEIFSEER